MHNRAKLLMTALAMANLVLLYRIDQQGNRLDETQSQNNARREKISYPATERSLLLSHLRDVLRSSDQSSFVLEGQDAARDKAVRYRAEDLDMVYVLSTQCAGCAVNLPLLIRMYSGGTRMVGISSQDSPGSLRAYVEQHKIPFPIVSRASGLVFRTLSKGTTPATVIFKNGEVNDLRVGDLTRAFPEAAQVTTRWTGDILSLLLANTSLIAPTSTEIPMAGNNRISKWTQVATSVAVIAGAFLVGQPSTAHAGSGSSGSCTQGKENGGPWQCCSCTIVNGENRDYVVSDCQLSSQNAFASCQDRTDPVGTCSGTCEAGTS